MNVIHLNESSRELRRVLREAATAERRRERRQRRGRKVAWLLEAARGA